jgi:hypothetical protein
MLENDKSVMAGSFHTLKLVHGRGVVQMIVEFPLERLPELIRAFGAPKPSEELPVAVAALIKTAVEE